MRVRLIARQISDIFGDTMYLAKQTITEVASFHQKVVVWFVNTKAKKSSLPSFAERSTVYGFAPK